MKLPFLDKENVWHSVSTDGGTWYPQACEVFKIDHHINSFLAKKEKSMIKRTMQYIKDRTENYDDYFPCRKQNCNRAYQKMDQSRRIIITTLDLNFTEPNFAMD